MDDNNYSYLNNLVNLAFYVNLNNGTSDVLLTGDISNDSTSDMPLKGGDNDLIINKPNDTK